MKLFKRLLLIILLFGLPLVAITYAFPPMAPQVSVSGGAATWGAIIGTLSNQADLNTALDARCLESVFGDAIGTGLLKDGTTLKASAILQEYHANDPSVFFLTITDDADAAAVRTTISAEQADTDIAKINEDENISGNWEVQDNINFSFGNDDDSSWAWDSADARLELRDVSDVPIFWFDLANSSFNVKAIASPQISLHDSGADGAERTDEYAGGIGANMTDTTEDAEISDFAIYAMNVDKRLIGEWDGSDESWTFGDGATGEDLKWDFETPTDNEIAVTSPNGATDINFGALKISGSIKGVVDANPADGEIDAYCYGGIFFASGTGTAVLPPVLEGMQVTVENHTAADVWLDPDGTEVIRLNGVAGGAGHRIIGTDLGDGCVCTYYSAGVWSCFCSGYADAGS